MGLGFFQSLRIFWMPPVMCIIAATSMAIWAREELLLLSPILIGWLIVPVLAWITSRPDLGDWARRHGLFLIQEENPQLSPAELRFVEQGVSDLGTAWGFPHGGIARAVIDPAEHFALLWDADSLRWLHHEFWSRPAMRLHPWWRQRLDEVIERIGLAR